MNINGMENKNEVVERRHNNDSTEIVEIFEAFDEIEDVVTATSKGTVVCCF